MEDVELNQRAVRRFLYLRLIDVERATGVPASRISESERGIRDLRPDEQRVVSSFLREKLQAHFAVEKSEITA